jgi:hypothetical protein
MVQWPEGQADAMILSRPGLIATEHKAVALKNLNLGPFLLVSVNKERMAIPARSNFNVLKCRFPLDWFISSKI